MPTPADSIIVEDGSGKEDANSYVSLAELLDFASLYDYPDVLTLTEQQQVAAILKACDYVESFSYRGIRAYSSQALEFPRLECFPTGAALPLPPDNIPSKLKRAQLYAATLSATGTELFPNVDSSSFVTKEKVGPIETEYANAAQLGMTRPIFTGIDSLLADYLTAGTTGRYAIRTVRI